jgi:hypothetical protein
MPWGSHSLLRDSNKNKKLGPERLEKARVSTLVQPLLPKRGRKPKIIIKLQEIKKSKMPMRCHQNGQKEYIINF